MSREYDARSRVPSKEYKDNFDAIFGKAKKARKERAEKRQKEAVEVVSRKVSPP